MPKKVNAGCTNVILIKYIVFVRHFHLQCVYTTIMFCLFSARIRFMSLHTFTAGAFVPLLLMTTHLKNQNKPSRNWPFVSPLADSTLGRLYSHLLGLPQRFQMGFVIGTEQDVSVVVCFTKTHPLHSKLCQICPFLLSFGPCRETFVWVYLSCVVLGASAAQPCVQHRRHWFKHRADTASSF